MREIKLEKLGAKDSIFDRKKNSLANSQTYDIKFSQVEKKMPGLVGFASTHTNKSLRSLVGPQDHARRREYKQRPTHQNSLLSLPVTRGGP